MAKRRTLKKNINYICSELFAECVALTHYKVDIKQEDVDNVMTRILLMHDEFVSRISHTEPGNVKGCAWISMHRSATLSALSASFAK